MILLCLLLGCPGPGSPPPLPAGASANLPPTAPPPTLPGPDPSSALLAEIAARFAASSHAPSGPPIVGARPPRPGEPPSLAEAPAVGPAPVSAAPPRR